MACLVNLQELPELSCDASHLSVTCTPGCFLLSQAVFMVGFSSDADKLFADANQTASEAFNNIRTVWCQQCNAMSLQFSSPCCQQL